MASRVESRGNVVERGNMACVELDVFATQFANVVHGFATKRGAGRRAKGKVDFREPPEGDAKLYKQSMADLAKTLGVAEKRVIYPKQEHGARVLLITKENLPSDLATLREERADAVITNVPGLPIAVRTADCIPILLHDFRAGVVAAVHAGWRGTVAGVLERTVRVMAKEFNTEPDSLAVAIGPGISMESFEVDEPVLTRFREAFDFWSRFARPTRNGRWLVDLKMINAYLLASAGVTEKNLEISPFCTVQDKDIFHSYRREGEGTGRMINFIMLKKE